MQVPTGGLEVTFTSAFHLYITCKILFLPVQRIFSEIAGFH